MPDINLLKDTKKPDEEAGEKGSLLERLDLSQPERFEFKEKEGRPASGFSQWVKRLFRRSTAKPKTGILEARREGTDISSTLQAAAPTELGQADERFRGLKPLRATADQRPATSNQRPTMRDQGSGAGGQGGLAPRPLPGGANSRPERPAGIQTTPPPPMPPKHGKPSEAAGEAEEPPAGGFDVNLLPEELVGQYEPRKKLINLGITSGLTVVAVAAIYVIMIVYQSSIVSRTETVRTEANTINQQISQLQETRTAALALKDKVEAIAERLDQHIYWTTFFAQLEKYTVPDVYYSNVFAGDINGQLTLEATGRDFSSVARQLLAFQQADDFVETVVINSASRVSEVEGGGETVSFGIELKLVEGVFFKTAAAADQTPAP